LPHPRRQHSSPCLAACRRATCRHGVGMPQLCRRATPGSIAVSLAHVPASIVAAARGNRTTAPCSAGAIPKPRRRARLARHPQTSAPCPADAPRGTSPAGSRHPFIHTWTPQSSPLLTEVKSHICSILFLVFVECIALEFVQTCSFVFSVQCLIRWIKVGCMAIHLPQFTWMVSKNL
jgi:hypothetical protein